MLTQQDLEAIGNLIDKKLDEKFEKELKPIKAELKSLRADMNELKRDVHQLKVDVNQLKTDVHELKIDVKHLKRESRNLRMDLNLVVKFFDNDITGIRKRVDRLEDYLRLPPLSN